MLSKFGNIFRWIYGHIAGRPTNFNWLIDNKLAGCGIPTSLREVKWLSEKQGIRSLATVEEKALPADWFLSIPVENFYLNTEDYGAPSVEELDKVVNHINKRIENQKPAVHCSGGKGRTGTILAAYLIHNKNPITAREANKKVSESIQSKEQENVLLKYEDFVKKSA